jgi:Carbohydrate esterase, sialic acid-specific acetylesterase
MLLWEGEAQAQNWPMLPALYRYNLASMLDATRLALDAPHMRVVIARIFPHWDREGVVRQAQVEIGSLPHHAWVDTDDVTKMDDGGHSDVAGTVEVGRRMRLAERGIVARGE